MAILKKRFTEIPENLTIEDLNLEPLVISEITEWRKIRINQIVEQEETKVRLIPALGFEAWFLKEDLRMSQSKEFWLCKEKYQSIYGKNA